MYFYFLTKFLVDIDPVRPTDIEAPSLLLSSNELQLNLADFHYFYDRCGLFIMAKFNATYNDLLIGKIKSSGGYTRPIFYENMESQIRNFVINQHSLTKFVAKILKEKMIRDKQPQSNVEDV